MEPIDRIYEDTIYQEEASLLQSFNENMMNKEGPSSRERLIDIVHVWMRMK